jgi:delta24-sterol reductase
MAIHRNPDQLLSHFPTMPQLQQQNNYSTEVEKAHINTVQKIVNEVKDFHRRQVPFRIYHGTTCTTRQLHLERDKIIDTSDMVNIISIDSERMTALVEPNVPMDKLVQEALSLKLMPPVVMEFPGITAGGGFAGTGAESSSFKYGLFEQTVTGIDIVLANGELVHASRSEREDLFYGSGSSFGTTGVITLLEIKLVKASEYVHMDYIPVSSASDAIEAMNKAMRDDSVDYIESFLYSPNNAVVCLGHLCDERPPGCRLQKFTRAHDPWFYLHARDMAKDASHNTNGGKASDVIPLKDYLFRHDRGAFWGGEYAYRYFFTPFNRVTRYLLNFLMHTRTIYRALHESGLAQNYIIQDLGIPEPNAVEFVDFLDQKFGIYPITLCPLDRGHVLPLYPVETEFISKEFTTLVPWINVGVYGPGPREAGAFWEANQDIEDKVRKLKGLKWLYALVCCNEEQFWEPYHRDRYLALRKEYHATTLPSVFDKVKHVPEVKASKIKELGRVAGLYGVLRVIFPRDYILANS